MADELKDQRIPIMMSRREVEAIDQWRREQSDVPARAEAIRRMVALVIEAKAAPKNTALELEFTEFTEDAKT
jgi:hypothetical protein